MRMEQLINQWKMLPKEVLDGEEYLCKVSYTESAKIKAIQELYPGLTAQVILHQLLVSALNSFEESLPYIQGSNVTGEDEFGEPIFEDIGDTPRYLRLIDKHCH